MALGAGRGPGRGFLRAAAAAAAAFSISCLAARRAALRFVRGAMDGEDMLLGRGFDLTGAGSAGAAPEPALPTEPLRLVRAGLAGTIEARGAAGRTATLDGRGATRFGVDTDAAEAGREGGLVCSELVELLRESPGSFGAVGGRNWNDDGGPWSLDARSAALLFSRGATVGAWTDATEMVSLRLWPGTPSNVCLSVPSVALVLLTGAGGGRPSRRAVARVMRGAMVGAAVDATAMLSARL